MGACCGTGGSGRMCCGPSIINGIPQQPVGYGLGCCGCPAECCGYGEGLGIGGPCSCAGNCCGTGANVFSNPQYFYQYCCSCCGAGTNKCYICGKGSKAIGCGGNGFCGGGSCCCCAVYQQPKPPRIIESVCPSNNLPSMVSIKQQFSNQPQIRPIPSPIVSHLISSNNFAAIPPVQIQHLFRPNNPITTIPQLSSQQLTQPFYK